MPVEPTYEREPSVPVASGERFRVLAARALTRHCPYCGGGGIFSGWFSLKERCPHCGTLFEREDGYFLGGYALNLVGAEIIGLGLAVYLIFFTRLKHAPLLAQEAIAISLAVALPILFFPYSRTVWMALDLFFSPPHQHPDRNLRASEMAGPKREPR